MSTPISTQTTVFLAKEAPSFKSRCMKKLFQYSGLKQIMNKPGITRRLIPFVHTPTPPAYLKRKYTISEQLVDHRKVFTLLPQRPTSTIILYLHGGAFVLNMTTPHWKFIDQLMTQTSCTVVVPDYPLLPEATYKERLDLAEKVYLELSSEAGAHHLLLMGDSSGGNMALALAQRIKTKGIATPAQVVLLSPWLDVSMSNPDIQSIVTKDPMLSYSGAIDIGKQHAGTAATTDPEISPMYGVLQGIGRISLFTGTDDLLHPDAKKLLDRSIAEQLPLNYYEYPHMMHAWMLFDLPESKQVIDQVVELIKENNIL